MRAKRAVNSLAEEQQEDMQDDVGGQTIRQELNQKERIAYREAIQRGFLVWSARSNLSVVHAYALYCAQNDRPLVVASKWHGYAKIYLSGYITPAGRDAILQLLRQHAVKKCIIRVGKWESEATRIDFEYMELVATRLYRLAVEHRSTCEIEEGFPWPVSRSKPKN